MVSSHSNPRVPDCCLRSPRHTYTLRDNMLRAIACTRLLHLSVSSHRGGLSRAQSSEQDVAPRSSGLMMSRRHAPEKKGREQPRTNSQGKEKTTPTPVSSHQVANVDQHILLYQPGDGRSDGVEDYRRTDRVSR